MSLIIVIVAFFCTALVFSSAYVVSVTYSPRRMFSKRQICKVPNHGTQLYAVGNSGASGSKGSTGCKICGGKGAINCVPCAGRGIDKKNGNVFERWTCTVCKGFGFVTCSCNPSRGLTPEQRGER
eukprot:gene5895-11903_t